MYQQNYGQENNELLFSYFFDMPYPEYDGKNLARGIVVVSNTPVVEEEDMIIIDDDVEEID